MGFIGSPDGRMHVSIDGLHFSYPSITPAEAAILNKLIEGREAPRSKEKKNCPCCGKNISHLSSSCLSGGTTRWDKDKDFVYGTSYAGKEVCGDCSSSITTNFWKRVRVR